MDRAIVLSVNWRLIIGRLTFHIEIRTPAGAALDREAAAWCRLREQAVAASDSHTVEWAIDDLYAAGGNKITACALLRRIIDGSFRPRW